MRKYLHTLSFRKYLSRGRWWHSHDGECKRARERRWALCVLAAPRRAIAITVKRQYSCASGVSVQNARPRRIAVYITVRGKITHPRGAHGAFPHRIFYRQGAHLAPISPLSFFICSSRPFRAGRFSSVATAPEILAGSPACNLTFKAPRYNFTLCLSYIWYRLCAFARQISGLLSETGEFFYLFENLVIYLPVKYFNLKSLQIENVFIIEISLISHYIAKVKNEREFYFSVYY